jgi:hypothetical protein
LSSAAARITSNVAIARFRSGGCVVSICGLVLSSDSFVPAAP